MESSLDDQTQPSAGYKNSIMDEYNNLKITSADDAELLQHSAYEQQKLHLRMAYEKLLNTRVQHQLLEQQKKRGFYGTPMSKAMAKLLTRQENQQMTVKAVLSYFYAVKQKIGHIPSFWNEFSKIMEDMRSERVNVFSVLRKIRNLFSEFPDLLKGFEMFLPPSFVFLLYSDSSSLPGASHVSPKSSVRLVQPVSTPLITKETSLELNSSCTEVNSVNANTDSSFVSVPKGKSLHPAPNGGCTPANNKIHSHKNRQPVSSPKKCVSAASKGKNSVPVVLLQKKKNCKKKLSTLNSKLQISWKYPRCDHLSDLSVSAVSKYGSFKELKFFDKVKKALGYQEVYENFMRCLNLFNEDVINRTELVTSVTPFLGKFPELMKELKDILKIPVSGEYVDPLPHKIVNMKKVDPDTAMEIDYCTGKKNVASYRALPRCHPPQKCTGRTALCREVLNDTWASFPSWSEESTCLPSVKTQYEESMYRIEDERFELDLAIQTNGYVIQLLENIQKKISKMTDEEKARFTLDDALGGSSAVLIRKFLQRIYGEKTGELIEGLKRNPVVAVPIVLNRLRMREREWKDVQKQYNDIWKDQILGIYPKSLDHQGINFKQVDSKNLRPKTLLNEIETLYEEKRQKISESSVGGMAGPHIILRFRDLRVFKDAAAVLLQHIKRQPGIYKDDRQGIGDLLSNFITDFFGIDRKILSTRECDVKKETGTTGVQPSGGSSGDQELETDEAGCSKKKQTSCRFGTKSRRARNAALVRSARTGLPYGLFYVNNVWYIFFRLFFVLLNRLAILLKQSERMEKEEVEDKKGTASGASEAPPSPYSAILGKIGFLLCGKIDSSTFEEEARDLFGVHAYISYTVDKVIQNIVKQMHQISVDEVAKQCTIHCIQHALKISSRGVSCPWILKELEEAYKKKVLKAIGDDNCYKVVWHKKEGALTIELLDPVKELSDEPNEAEKFSDYVDSFLDVNATDSTVKKPSFLSRNLRKQKKLWRNYLIWQKTNQNETEIKSPVHVSSVSENCAVKKGPGGRKGKRVRIQEPAAVINNAVSDNLHISNNVSSAVPVKKRVSNAVSVKKHVSNAVSVSKHVNNAVPVSKRVSSAISVNKRVNSTVPTSKRVGSAVPLSKGVNSARSMSNGVNSVVSMNNGVKSVIGLGKSKPGRKRTMTEHQEDLPKAKVAKATSGLAKNSLNNSVSKVLKRPVIRRGRRKRKARRGIKKEPDDQCSEQPVDKSASHSNPSHSAQQITSQGQFENGSEQDDQNGRVDLNETNKIVDVANDDEDEDSINISADDLLFHLTQTGMAIYEHYSEGFGFKSSRSESTNLNPSVDVGFSTSNASSCFKIPEVTSGSESAFATDIKPLVSSKAENLSGSSRELKNIEICANGSSQEVPCVDATFNGAPSIYVASVEQEVASSVEVSTAEQDNTLPGSAKSMCQSKQVMHRKSLRSCLRKQTQKKRHKPSNCHSKSKMKAFKVPKDVPPSEEDCLNIASKDVVIQENTVCRFGETSYKITFAAGFGDFLYRRGALLKAKKKHAALSVRLSKKFNVFHKVWLERYVTPNMLKSCHLWMMRSEPDKFRVDCITVNDYTKPPYAPYTKYKVRYYKRLHARR